MMQCTAWPVHADDSINEKVKVSSGNSTVYNGCDVGRWHLRVGGWFNADHH